MCPACLTTLAVIAAGTGSAGGLTAVVAKKLHDRRVAKTHAATAQEATTRPEKTHPKEDVR